MKALLQDGRQAHMPTPPEKRLLINFNYDPDATVRSRYHFYIGTTIPSPPSVVASSMAATERTYALIRIRIESLRIASALYLSLDTKTLLQDHPVELLRRAVHPVRVDVLSGGA